MDFLEWKRLAIMRLQRYMRLPFNVSLSYGQGIITCDMELHTYIPLEFEAVLNLGNENITVTVIDRNSIRFEITINAGTFDADVDAKLDASISSCEAVVSALHDIDTDVKIDDVRHWASDIMLNYILGATAEISGSIKAAVYIPSQSSLIAQVKSGTSNHLQSALGGTYTMTCSMDDNEQLLFSATVNFSYSMTCDFDFMDIAFITANLTMENLDMSLGGDLLNAMDTIAASIHAQSDVQAAAQRKDTHHIHPSCTSAYYITAAFLLRYPAALYNHDYRQLTDMDSDTLNVLDYYEGQPAKLSDYDSLQLSALDPYALSQLYFIEE